MKNIFIICVAFITLGACGSKKITATPSYNPTSIFTDLSCSQLKAGITDKDIKNIPNALYKSIAEKLKKGTYEGKEFRIQEYRPYENSSLSKGRNKILHEWGYLDNITGIYVDSLVDTLHVLVGDTHGQDIYLIVQNYRGKWDTYRTQLKEGMNVLTPGTEGLCYILLQTDELLPLHPESEADKKKIKDKSVKVHFASGKVNGYYDVSKHSPKDAETILANAKHPYIDMKGKYAMLVWYTDQFREHNGNLAVSCAHVDEMSRLEQEAAGLFKYNKAFTTRILFMPSSNGGGSPNATKNRTIYPKNYHGRFVVAETMIPQLWGPAHEVGHCTQLNPALRWGGMGEVGNNYFSMYVKTRMAGFNKSNLLLEDQYSKARTSIVEANIPHSASKKLMEKLVPIWQVELYISEARGNKDFHKDLFEHFRTTTDVGTTFKNSGPLQLDYVRQVCRIGKVDLIDFFKKWGFLTPVDTIMNDYGDRILKISQEDIDVLITEIEAMKLPKPTKDVTLIRDDNFAEFK